MKALILKVIEFIILAHIIENGDTKVKVLVDLLNSNIGIVVELLNLG